VSALVATNMDLDVKDVLFVFTMMSVMCLQSQSFVNRTALHIAVLGNHRFVVKALVDGGANRSLRDVGGMTPRSLASNLHHVDLLEFLMPESEKQARREGFCWRGRRRYYFRPGEPRPS
jgi:hypothetical protein